MKCSRVLNLISPYVDQQLTGVEMLEIEKHLSQCERCRTEWETICQVKQMMRRLCFREPDGSLDQRIMMRIYETRTSPAALSAAFATISAEQIRSFYALNRPRHPRRLAAALALSCIALFTVAAPFAPSTADETLHTVAMSAGPPLFWSSFGRPQIAPAGAADGSLAEPAGYVESAPATAYADARAQGGEPMLLRTVSQPQIAPPSHPTFYTSSPNGYNNSYVEMAGYQP